MRQVQDLASGRRLSIAAAILPLLAGCHSAASAGSAATVNGEPITMNQVAAETQPGAPAGSEAGDRSLDELVNRKVLSQEAVRQHLDESADTKLALEKARDLVLADALTRHIADQQPMPAAPAIDSFIQKHPKMFAAREILVLDQLQVAAAAVDAKWLRSAKTITEAAAILRAHAVPFEQGRARVDTATLPPVLLDFIARSPTEPFAVPQGAKLIVNQLIARQPAPVPAAQVHEAAVTAMRREVLVKKIPAELATLRAAASISYANGFAAPRPAAAPGSPR